MKRTVHDFKVVENRNLSGGYFTLKLNSPAKLQEIHPGQFAQVLVENSVSTYLRRPFSIYDFDEAGNTITLLIKVVGKGSSVLQALKVNDSLNLIYPLGNTFSVPAGKSCLLIGGGVGIAPMLLLAKSLSGMGKDVDVLIGGRSSLDILEPERYEKFGRVFITTDDGSLGEKGMVTQHTLFKAERLNYSAVYACGPDPMMRAVAALSAKHGIYCEVSLENLMACGIGACLCCIVETNEGNKTTCVEGPIFDSRQLKEWN